MWKFPISVCFYSLLSVIGSGGTVHAQIQKGYALNGRAVNGVKHVKTLRLCDLTRREMNGRSHFPAGLQVRVEVVLPDLPEVGSVPGAHQDAPGAADLPLPPLQQGVPLTV